MRSKKVHPDKNNATMIVAYFLGFVAVVGFGATLPVTRIAIEFFSPEFITFARAVLATLLAASTLGIFRRAFIDTEWKATFISGLFLIFAFPGFIAIAMQSVPAAHGGVVLGFLPLATAVIARILANEHPSPRFWMLSVLGVVIVIAFILLKAGTPASAGSLAGYLWLILAGLSAACGYVIFGKLSREKPGWEIICRALILNAPLTALGFVWTFDPNLFDAPVHALVALTYLGAISMFMAFCAWNVALAIGGIARIGQLQLLQIFVTLVVAAILLGETPDLLTIVAAITVTTIIALNRN